MQLWFDITQLSALQIYEAQFWSLSDLDNPISSSGFIVYHH
jgi:lysozyme family protein